MENIYRILNILLLSNFYVLNVFADSPSFVTQEIADEAKDWNITTIYPGNSGLEIIDAKIICDKLNNFIITPDIKSVKYLSDGKVLKGNVYLTYPFDINPVEKYNDTKTQKVLKVLEVNNLYKRYSMIIDTKSVFDTGPDYGIERFWDPINYDRTWYRSIFELSSDGNFTGLSNKEDASFINNSIAFKDIPFSIPFEFDLSIINSPSEYNTNVLFEEGYEVVLPNSDRIYCNRADVSQWMPVPQPEISISFSSNSVNLRPGEEENLLLKIENNANLNTRIFFNSYHEEEISVDILPNPIFISPSSNGTAIVKIGSSSSESQTIPVKIKSQIEFPQNITLIGTNTTITNVSDALISIEREFTVNLLPKYRIDEYLSIFVDRYITPLNSIWTFFSGIAIALSPQIIRFLQKFFTSKTEEKENQGTKTRKF